MANLYYQVIDVTDFGPYVTKLVLGMPGEIVKADLKPEEIWFCGDTYDMDIKGARAAGITPVFYQGQTEGSPRRNSAPAGGTADILLVTDWKEFTEMLARPE